MIAVIGEKGTDACDANVRVLQALSNVGMPISTINQGAGKLNLLIGVPEERYEDVKIRREYVEMSRIRLAQEGVDLTELTAVKDESGHYTLQRATR